MFASFTWAPSLCIKCHFSTLMLWVFRDDIFASKKLIQNKPKPPKIKTAKTNHTHHFSLPKNHHFPIPIDTTTVFTPPFSFHKNHSHLPRLSDHADQYVQAWSILAPETSWWMEFSLQNNPNGWKNPQYFLGFWKLALDWNLTSRKNSLTCLENTSQKCYPGNEELIQLCVWWTPTDKKTCRVRVIAKECLIQRLVAHLQAHSKGWRLLQISSHKTTKPTCFDWCQGIIIIVEL